MSHKSHNSVISSYSELVSYSDFFTNWLGYNQQIVKGICIKTSNRLLKDYHINHNDYNLNVIALKQLITYENYQTVYTILTNGIQVEYQTYTMIITIKKTCLYVQVENMKTSFSQTLKVSKTNLNKLARVIDNQDALDTLQSIYNRIQRDLG